MLITHWQDRLGLQTRPVTKIAELRKHPEAGELFGRWRLAASSARHDGVG
jgi:hypothetical protein